MSPDYFICLECETPCYVFEFQEGKLVEAVCTACGNEDVDLFLTEEAMEALAMGE